MIRLIFTMIRTFYINSVESDNNEQGDESTEAEMDIDEDEKLIYLSIMSQSDDNFIRMILIHISCLK